MMKKCIPLSDIADDEAIGGKAANLAKLKRDGFPVPDAFVVTVSAYDEFFLQNSIYQGAAACLSGTDFENAAEVVTCSQRIKDMIMSSHLGDGLKEEISSLIAEYGDEALWAVRSSAVAEDLPEASFAGQQDTFLNVAPENVHEAVMRCWASFWNDRAIVYRHNANIPHSESGIAVIVQRMVDADSSGILFTRDPLKQSSGNMIIESSWGLGESIVSGSVSPDRFVYDPSTREIVERRIGRKKKALYLGHGENAHVDVEAQRQTAPSLGDEDIVGLVSLGRRIEDFFDCPQDIEWSIDGGNIYILQSRPITTLTKGEEILWTRAYGDEYWADVTSPLFFSVLGHYLANYVNSEGSRVMGYTELTGLKLLKLYKGHIYFNSKVLEEVFTFNPKFSRTKELLNYFPVADQERIANARTKTIRRLWAEARIMLTDPDGSIMRTDKAYRRWAEKYMEDMRQYDALDLATLDDAELEGQYTYMERSFLKHFRLIRYGMVTHSIGTNLMVKKWLIDWLGDTNGELYSRLISGLPENKTIRTNAAMANLAEIIRANEKLVGALSDGGAKAFLDEIRVAPEYGAYESFLREYGHRSHTRELFYPRWVEDQTLIADILRSLVRSSSLDFVSMEREKIKEREQTEREILERIGKMHNGSLRRILFRTVMKYAQTYLIFRENQRFYLDHILFRIRRLFLEYGRRFSERGLIGDPNDIFFLSREEIFSIANGGDKGPLAQVGARRREFEKYRGILPPKFLRGRIEFDDTVMYEDGVLSITGTSASPGVVTGRARIIESIGQLSDIRENEILITSNTDPGWTPVFAKLGGLITETGGILSHGAVVSREYGIPAVTAVKGATSYFKTGQRLTVDGNNGVIYITK